MTDVLVIGGGLAGWRAAEAASKAGCSVTLVANGTGNSPQIHALNCPVRPDDSAERMFADTMASGHGTNDPALVRILCEGAVKLKDEFPFDRTSDGAYLAIQPLGSSVPRCVSIDHAIGAWALAKIRQQCGQGVPALADETWSGRPRPDTSRSDNFDGGRCPSLPSVQCLSGRVESLRWIPQSQGEDALATREGDVARRQGEDALATGAEATWSGRPRPDTYPPTFFPGLDGYALQSVKVGRGEMLPHWTLSGALYHVVFRLADSVPAERIAAWRAEREDLKRRSEKSALTSEESSRLEWLQSAAVDEYLDAGAGACWLKRPDVRDVMLRTLERGNEGKFYLHAVGVMPNHLHLVFQLAENESLQGVMQSLKGATAHAANRILGRSGDFWQADFYNYIIRTQEEYSHQVGYVGVKNAGVFGWRLGKGVWTTGNEKCGERTEEGLFEVVVRGCQGEDALATGEGDVARRQGEDALATEDGTKQCGQGVPALATGDGDVARASSPLQSRIVLSARAIVLATGGWCGKYGFSTNPPELRGDGIALAQALGAATRDLDAVQYEPTVAIAPSALRGIPVITTMLYEGATIRNASGKEFLSSRHLNKDEMSKEIVEEIVAGRGVNCQGEDALATGNGVWYDMTGVPADVLRGKYGATYRRYASVGIDISRQLVLVAPAPHTSLGGVVIDTACRVLKPDGSAIPGLFAAGEVTGGLHGRNRLGGNAGTEVLVFGRIAGEEAARFVAGASSPRK